MRALGIVMYLLKISLGSWLPGRNKMFGSSTIKECFKTKFFSDCKRLALRHLYMYIASFFIK